MNDEKSGVDRRFFLKAMGISLTCPLWTACEFVDVYDTELVDSEEFDLNDEAFQGLAEVGGTACLEAGSLSLLLIRRSDTEVLATERLCPHQNLNMGPCGNNPVPAVWDPDAEELTCRWHNSVFGLDGSVKRGPAPRGLRIFPVDFDPATGLGQVQITES